MCLMLGLALGWSVVPCVWAKFDGNAFLKDVHEAFEEYNRVSCEIVDVSNHQAKAARFNTKYRAIQSRQTVHTCSEDAGHLCGDRTWTFQKYLHGVCFAIPRELEDNQTFQRFLTDLEEDAQRSEKNDDYRSGLGHHLDWRQRAWNIRQILQGAVADRRLARITFRKSTRQTERSALDKELNALAASQTRASDLTAKLVKAMSKHIDDVAARMSQRADEHAAFANRLWNDYVARSSQLEAEMNDRVARLSQLEAEMNAGMGKK